MKFTLEDFRNGKVAIQGNGTQKMKDFLKQFQIRFEDTGEPLSAGSEYYYEMRMDGGEMKVDGYLRSSLPIVQFSDLVQPTNLPKAYKGEIADFPQEVVEMMLLRQVEQGNKKDVSVFEKDRWVGREDGGFYWYRTSEGDDFWTPVIVSKMWDVFFDKYPKQQQVIYTKEYIRDNKIAIHCPTEEQFQAIIEHFNIDKLRGSGTSYIRYKENTTIQLYWYSRGKSPEEDATFGEVSWAKEHDYTIISASEVLNQQQTNMNKNKNIIGYKLKKDAEQFRKAALIMINRGAFIDNEYGGKVDVKKSSNINIYKNAGVLDLWFEPVYSEKEQYEVGDWVVTSGSANGWGTGIEINNAVVQYVGDSPYTNEVIVVLNGKECYTGKSQIVRKATAAEIEKASIQVVSVGGAFNVTVKGKKVYHGSNMEDITEFVRGVKNFVDSIPKKIGSYDFIVDVDNIPIKKSGCESKKTYIKDWLSVVEHIK